jgi:hypothetical protein
VKGKIEDHTDSIFTAKYDCCPLCKTKASRIEKENWKEFELYTAKETITKILEQINQYLEKHKNYVKH